MGGGGGATKEKIGRSEKREEERDLERNQKEGGG